MTEPLDGLERSILEEPSYGGGMSADGMTTALGISRPASAEPALRRLEQRKLVRCDGAGNWWLTDAGAQK